MASSGSGDLFWQDNPPKRRLSRAEHLDSSGYAGEIVHGQCSTCKDMIGHEIYSTWLVIDISASKVKHVLLLDSRFEDSLEAHVRFLVCFKHTPAALAREGWFCVSC